MTIKLSDEEREAIVRKETQRPVSKLGMEMVARAAIDATLAHLNRQQEPEPDRFEELAEEITMLVWQEGTATETTETLATYLREQWEADRAELLERVLAALDDHGWSVTGEPDRIIKREFAKEPVR